jgi:uncharacterized protein YndB with AHSA1/START domain
METDIKNKVSTDINAPAEMVWKALTDPEIIKKYFFGTNTETNWKKGSPIRFHGEWQGKKYHDKGTILDIEEGKMIKYDYWSSMSGIEDKPENYVIITYELKPVDGKTRVEITQENIPDEKMREHSEQNWKMVLEGLKKTVEERKF